MIETRDSIGGVLETDSPSGGERPRGPNRRKFLGQIGATATFAAGAVATPSVSSAQAIGGSSNGPRGAAPLAGVNNRRADERGRGSSGIGGWRGAKHLATLGWERAGALVTLFAAAWGPKLSSLATPQFLFASDPIAKHDDDTSDEGPSQRPSETLTP